MYRCDGNNRKRQCMLYFELVSKLFGDFQRLDVKIASNYLRLTDDLERLINNSGVDLIWLSYKKCTLRFILIKRKL